MSSVLILGKETTSTHHRGFSSRIQHRQQALHVLGQLLPPLGFDAVGWPREVRARGDCGPHDGEHGETDGIHGCGVDGARDEVLDVVRVERSFGGERAAGERREGDG